MSSTTTDQPAVTFRATLLAGGRTATGIEVPDDVIATLGHGRRPPVSVTLAGHTYRTTVGAMGGRAMLPVSAENRRHAGVQAGDEVDVRLVLDTSPRPVEIPDDFGAAMDEAPATRGFFEALPNSLQRFHVDNVTGAKTDETRRRRIDKAVAGFRAGRRR